MGREWRRQGSQPLLAIPCFVLLLPCDYCPSHCSETYTLSCCFRAHPSSPLPPPSLPLFLLQ